MSQKVKNGTFVSMSKKEFAAYMKEHPNAEHFMNWKVIVHCDICGKRIDTRNHWLLGHIQFMDYHANEFHDLCSNSCAKEFMRRFITRFENQPAKAKNKLTGVSLNRCDEKTRAKGAKEE